jgi:hypothetical protein
MLKYQLYTTINEERENSPSQKCYYFGLKYAFHWDLTAVKDNVSMIFNVTSPQLY